MSRCYSCGFVRCRCGDLIDVVLTARAIEAYESGEKNVTVWTYAAHAQSVASGFYDDDPPKDFEHIAARVMLAVCELSEAIEELRNKPSSYDETYLSEGGKPEGFPIELADAVIRIFDLCGWLEIDIAQAMAIKHAYNATRPRRHGKPGL